MRVRFPPALHTKRPSCDGRALLVEDAIQGADIFVLAVAHLLDETKGACTPASASTRALYITLPWE